MLFIVSLFFALFSSYAAELEIAQWQEWREKGDTLALELRTNVEGVLNNNSSWFSGRKNLFEVLNSVNQCIGQDKANKVYLLPLLHKALDCNPYLGKALTRSCNALTIDECKTFEQDKINSKLLLWFEHFLANQQYKCFHLLNGFLPLSIKAVQANVSENSYSFKPCELRKLKSYKLDNNSNRLIIAQAERDDWVMESYFEFNSSESLEKAIKNEQYEVRTWLDYFKAIMDGDNTAKIEQLEKLPFYLDKYFRTVLSVHNKKNPTNKKIFSVKKGYFLYKAEFMPNNVMIIDDTEKLTMCNLNEFTISNEFTEFQVSIEKNLKNQLKLVDYTCTSFNEFYLLRKTDYYYVELYKISQEKIATLVNTCTIPFDKTDIYGEIMLRYIDNVKFCSNARHCIVNYTRLRGEKRTNIFDIDRQILVKNSPCWQNGYISYDDVCKEGVDRCEIKYAHYSELSGFDHFNEYKLTQHQLSLQELMILRALEQNATLKNIDTICEEAFSIKLSSQLKKYLQANKQLIVWSAEVADYSVVKDLLFFGNKHQQNKIMFKDLCANVEVDGKDRIVDLNSKLSNAQGCRFLKRKIYYQLRENRFKLIIARLCAIFNFFNIFFCMYFNTLYQVSAES